MGIYRDCFGRLVYKIGEFEVTRHRSNRPYTITRFDANAIMRTDAVLMPLWDTPKFDSFIQAARFLKDNLEQLV